ncbi:transposase, partial [Thiolapillus sp.]|uniref:transposase n=1 Tax=Thiolapillus sp. TaxID=2017437 RepID=UPI003AF90A7D
RVRRPTLFSLWRKARRENSAASRLLGSTSLRFALHGWQRRIKEQQLGLFADRTSSATLRANQLRLYFSSFAYVLLHGLRRLGLTGTAFAKAQSTTIRLKLLKIGARLRLTARKVWLSFSEAYPYASDIAQILANLKQHPAWSPPG